MVATITELIQAQTERLAKEKAIKSAAKSKHLKAGSTAPAFPHNSINIDF
jgi:hypothetical protein